MRKALFVLAAAALALPAFAQPIYVDFGNAFGVPVTANGFHAAAPNLGAPATWNNFSVAPTNAALVNINGSAAAPVTITATGANFNFSFNNAASTGDDQALMDDLIDGPTAITFNNLAAGNYQIYTYASAPDSAGFLTNVSIGGNNQVVGGAWVGPPLQYAQGITHALHNVNHPGGALTVNLSTAAGFASVNGIQIVPEPATLSLLGLAGLAFIRRR